MVRSDIILQKQEFKFSSKCDQTCTTLQETADLVPFTEEILDVKLPQDDDVTRSEIRACNDFSFYSKK